LVWNEGQFEIVAAVEPGSYPSMLVRSKPGSGAASARRLGIDLLEQS